MEPTLPKWKKNLVWKSNDNWLTRGRKTFNGFFFIVEIPEGVRFYRDTHIPPYNVPDFDLELGTVQLYASQESILDEGVDEELIMDYETKRTIKLFILNDNYNLEALLTNDHILPKNTPQKLRDVLVRFKNKFQEIYDRETLMAEDLIEFSQFFCTWLAREYELDGYAMAPPGYIVLCYPPNCLKRIDPFLRKREYPDERLPSVEEYKTSGISDFGKLGLDFRKVEMPRYPGLEIGDIQNYWEIQSPYKKVDTYYQYCGYEKIIDFLYNNMSIIRLELGIDQPKLLDLIRRIRNDELRIKDYDELCYRIKQIVRRRKIISDKIKKYRGVKLKYEPTEENVMKSISYLAYKHHNECVLYNTVIEWFRDTNTMELDEHQLRSNMDMCLGKNYIVLFLFIWPDHTKQVGHANVLIIDKIQKTVERFEPYGQSRANPILDKYLTNLFKSYKYIPPLDFCPKEGFQTIEEQLIERDPNLHPRGYCAVWSTWYVDLRLSNPDVPREVIINKAINYLEHPESFRTFIRSYSIYLAAINEEIKKLDKMGVTIDKTNIPYMLAEFGRDLV